MVNQIIAVDLHENLKSEIKPCSHFSTKRVTEKSRTRLTAVFIRIFCTLSVLSQ